jgi:Protein of unknown function (DUF998)
MPHAPSWTNRPSWAQAGAAAGIAGPAAFTGAWIASSLRQTGYPAAGIQLSGLAAPDARDPWIMVAGFVVLGGCTVAFGAALRHALDHAAGGQGRRRGGVSQGRRRGGVSQSRRRGGAGPAPLLIQGAGLLTIAAGLLRRDRMLLAAGSVSWHNHAHDLISALIYADLVAAQVLLAERFGRDPEALDADWAPWIPWAPWRPWLLASGLATGAALVAFAAENSAAGAGVLQRIAVTIPLAATAAVAVRLLWTQFRTPTRSGWP